MESLNNTPPVKWMLTHPRIAAWVVLSLGMVGLLIFEARDVGLQPGNWVALIAATVLVAGACIWIISWEDQSDPLLDTAHDDETTPPDAAVSKPEPAAQTDAAPPSADERPSL